LRIGVMFVMWSGKRVSDPELGWGLDEPDRRDDRTESSSACTLAEPRRVRDASAGKWRMRNLVAHIAWERLPNLVSNPHSMRSRQSRLFGPQLGRDGACPVSLLAPSHSHSRPELAPAQMANRKPLKAATSSGFTPRLAVSTRNVSPIPAGDTRCLS